ncbi:NAD-dependent epimerase/dehydratase family protein [Sphingomonas sp. YL-JM2C]
MKTLVVGGTGLIGAHVALALEASGHAVTIAARRPPEAAAVRHLPVLVGDYAAGDFTPDRLAGFDGLVFAAGNDFRHVPQGMDEAEHLDRVNIRGVPAFFAQARAAGVKRAVHVGTFYPHVAPWSVDASAYVRSRLLAEEAARALTRQDFAVCSVNPPFVLGRLEGVEVLGAQIHARYALGQYPDMPVFAIAGGTNFMTVHAVSDAVIGALARGEPGAAYLIGDENLSFLEYFRCLFDAAGNPTRLAVEDRSHPLLPDDMLYAGRGTVISYEPDPVERELLDYRRGDLGQVIRAIVADCRRNG